MAKKMWYEDRNAVFSKLWEKMVELDVVAEDDPVYDRLDDYFEEIMEVYTEGDYRSYN